MSKRLQRRLIIVTGIVGVVVICVLALVGTANSSSSITVAEAASGSYIGKKVQVTGQVVDNSYQLDEGQLTFYIYDEEDPDCVLCVIYKGSMSASFGNQVTAICTGTISEDGTLICYELVTKCPSKYENATEALTIRQLIDYGDEIYDVAVKVSGEVLPGSVKPASADERFVVIDPESGMQLSIVYAGGLPDGIGDGSIVVLTGSLHCDGRFFATGIAIAN
ncbi:MAG: cytochrome c maturation protein CcmE [Coriobacteriia bacterium]|nr:cytochrome c maturation protein CcmE [Coriobacteriia bacterium]